MTYGAKNIPGYAFDAAAAAGVDDDDGGLQ